MKLFLFIAALVVILSLAKCRRFSLKGRIVGGVPVSINEFPHQVSLRANGKHLCGATIISNNTILTAAHCTIRFEAQNLTITHGSTRANNGTIHQVKEIILTNPPYNKTTLENDISILKITPPIIFSNKSQAIKLSTDTGHLVEGSEVVISGWGKQNETEPTNLDFGARSLKAVTLKISNFDKCKEIYSTEFDVNIDGRMICAAARGRDSCKGDSGGPLIDKKTRQLVAILSFGNGCARENYPGVYTRVLNHLDFIKSNINKRVNHSANCRNNFCAKGNCTFASSTSKHHQPSPTSSPSPYRLKVKNILRAAFMLYVEIQEVRRGERRVWYSTSILIAMHRPYDNNSEQLNLHIDVSYRVRADVQYMGSPSPCLTRREEFLEECNYMASVLAWLGLATYATLLCMLPSTLYYMYVRLDMDMDIAVVAEAQARCSCSLNSKDEEEEFHSAKNPKKGYATALRYETKTNVGGGGRMRYADKEKVALPSQMNPEIQGNRKIRFMN
ncbi:ovochymase-1-like [Eupeodes corollae]|uniref:ovochymase-1-like n=1 Tax=Eupeodes corollae TaxID=290404 RepID=UPI002491974E|nr:ovochymase-1-like [Eupeodes corollae]